MSSLFSWVLAIQPIWSLVLAFGDLVFFQGVLLWEAEGPIFWNIAAKELNVGKAIRTRICQRTYATPQQVRALEMVVRLVLHVWPYYSCFVIKDCGDMPLRHLCVWPTMIKVD